jgi:homocysteine S-methyltransferase
MTTSRALPWELDPALPGYVTDGGLETDLVFHHGVELTHFAAFPLLVDPKGRQLLVDYYSGYAQIASTAGAGLFLETPTWRASSDWGARLGVGAEGLVGVNTDAVRLLAELGQRYSDEVPEVVVAGLVGPRGDGYVVAEVMDPWQARDYHLAQARALADAGADLLSSLTLTTVTEAIGVALAAGEVGLPVTVGFTVETDGRLPDGTTLRAAIEAVDDVTPPDWFVVNCAHPSHVAAAVVDTGPWLDRIGGARRRAGGAGGIAAGAARGRWLLRHRCAPRGGHVGGPCAGGPDPSRRVARPSATSNRCSARVVHRWRFRQHSSTGPRQSVTVVGAAT